jgi:hypothetical protein
MCVYTCALMWLGWWCLYCEMRLYQFQRFISRTQHSRQILLVLTSYFLSHPFQSFPLWFLQICVVKFLFKKFKELSMTCDLFCSITRCTRANLLSHMCSEHATVQYYYFYCCFLDVIIFVLFILFLQCSVFVYLYYVCVVFVFMCWFYD